MFYQTMQNSARVPETGAYQPFGGRHCESVGT